MYLYFDKKILLRQLLFVVICLPIITILPSAYGFNYDQDRDSVEFQRGSILESVIDDDYETRSQNRNDNDILSTIIPSQNARELFKTFILTLPFKNHGRDSSVIDFLRTSSLEITSRKQGVGTEGGFRMLKMIESLLSSNLYNARLGRQDLGPNCGPCPECPPTTCRTKRKNSFVSGIGANQFDKFMMESTADGEQKFDMYILNSNEKLSRQLLNLINQIDESKFSTRSRQKITSLFGGSLGEDQLSTRKTTLKHNLGRLFEQFSRVKCGCKPCYSYACDSFIDDGLNYGRFNLSRNRRVNELFPDEFQETIPCSLPDPVCRLQDTCGRVAAVARPKMNGGQAARDKQWPFFIQLDISKGGSRYSCSGVLIAPKLVLTAAHCIMDSVLKGPVHPSAVKVIAGSTIIGDYQAEVRDAVHICFSRKNFVDKDPDYLIYDYAFITLDRSLPINADIRYACMPHKPMDISKTECHIIGAGRILTPNGLLERPQLVQTMQVKHVPCDVWGIPRDDRSRLCFTKKFGLGDSCAGDSGGPILCWNNGWNVVGLTSYGSERCDGTTRVGFVGVYANVRYLLKDMQMHCGSQSRIQDTFFDFPSYFGNGFI